MAAILLLGILVFPQAFLATADESTEADIDISTTLPATSSPETPVVESPVVTTPPTTTPPTTTLPSTPPVGPATDEAPATVETPATVEASAPKAPVPEPATIEEPVQEIVEEVPAEAESTTAAPTTAAPSTAPATTRPTPGSPSNTEQALPIESSSSNTPAPSNSLLLQLLVIGLLLAICLWYLRFMKRGGKHLGVDSTGPVN